MDSRLRMNLPVLCNLEQRFYLLGLIEGHNHSAQK